MRAKKHHKISYKFCLMNNLWFVHSQVVINNLFFGDIHISQVPV